MEQTFQQRFKDFRSALISRWPDFDSGLNAFFDESGFTERFIANFKIGREKQFRDSVWGMIELDPSTVALVDSPLLQRLRYISQLGLSQLTYPTANHNRFQHSLGVFNAVSRILDEIDRNAKKKNVLQDGKVSPIAFDDNQRALATSAALLHDIGHGPFSHVIEAFVTKKTRQPRFLVHPLKTLSRFLRSNISQSPRRKARPRQAVRPAFLRYWRLPCYRQNAFSRSTTK